METKLPRKITFGEAMLVIVFLIASLMSTLMKFGGDPHMPLLASAIFASLIAIRAGYKWQFIEEGVTETIKMAMQSVLILMVIGCIIGTWILSGVVPTMIYYGLKLISPGIFLVATCLICSIVSLATGSSWTTAGTVGIALLGVGGGLGIPAPMVAGAIISGAYFGDKMSPLSDTTNLAPAMAGAKLFDHIKHMCFTTGPSLLISCIIFGILGLKYAGKELDTATINTLLDALNGQFNINPLLLLPPVLVILMVVFKVPALPGLLGGTILGGIFAAVFQGAGMSAIIDAAHYGYTSETGIEAVDSLLSRGGLDSMMWTVSLILIALSFGGIMERTGMLQVIAEKILKLANSTGSLVLATFITCIFCNLATGDQYLSLVIPGRMYKDVYREKGLHPKNLSRCLEDFGTITSPLVPWNTCGAFMTTALGMHPFAYLPFAFLNLINPLVSIFYGFTGITMEKLPQEKEGEKIA
ncbi:Na+/H+ antiporter NhaC [Crassaminicella thermophila]|uniref:Na+/H+ antiporter NhaC n=1 Tax=Crassaminicella thermophila TaxID=2599308 RepID=A0A5C0SDP3_CRATE|nr:Na+/H+ antiporter NhaC [Crassaminicella thermophila]QEK11059.1 Na+/H+ antiporter NhaC [Crassaminicella thermophila]